MKRSQDPRASQPGFRFANGTDRRRLPRNPAQKESLKEPEFLNF